MGKYGNKAKRSTFQVTINIEVFHSIKGQINTIDIYAVMWLKSVI